MEKAKIESEEKTDEGRRYVFSGGVVIQLSEKLNKMHLEKTSLLEEICLAVNEELVAKRKLEVRDGDYKIFFKETTPKMYKGYVFVRREEENPYRSAAIKAYSLVPKRYDEADLINEAPDEDETEWIDPSTQMKRTG